MNSGSKEDQAPDGEKSPALRAQARGGAPAAGSKLQDVLGKALQAHYRALAEAPLPDRLLELLAEVEAKVADDDK
jgi:hypothetical protein